MQANDKNKDFLDDRFFDQAWENMRGTLDKEMPNKKKRRFLPFFWLMTGTVIGIILLVGISFSNQKETDIIATDISQVSSISSVEKTYEVIASIESNQNLNKQSILKSAPNKRINQLNANQQQVVHKIHHTPSIVSKKQNIYKGEKSITKNVQQNIHNSKSTTTNRQFSTSLVLLESINPVLEYNESLKEFQLDDKYLASEVTGNLCPPKRKIEFGINGGLAYDFSAPKRIGFASGAFVHFPIGKKWGIKTGLGYSLLAKNLSFNISENHAVVLADNTGTGIGFGANYGDLNQYQLNVQAEYQLKRIHYLEIPLAATFRINKKWTIQAGANFSKALKGKFNISGDRDFSLIDNTPIPSTTTTLELNNVRTTGVGDLSISEDLWNKDFVSGLLGFSWTPTKHLTFNLLLYQGLIDFSSTGDSDNFPFQSPIGSSLSNSESFSKYSNLNKYPRSLRLTIGYKF